MRRLKAHTLTAAEERILAAAGEGVCLQAAHIGQITAVTLQFGLLSVEALHILIRDSHDFGSSKTALRTDLDHNTAEFAIHSLVNGVAGILVTLAHAVACQAAHTQISHFISVQEGIQILSIIQLARKGCQVLAFFDHCGKILFPQRVRCIKILSSPGMLDGDLLTLPNLFHFTHLVTS